MSFCYFSFCEGEKYQTGSAAFIYVLDSPIFNGRFKGLDGGEGHVVVPGTGNIESKFRSFWIFCLCEGDDTIVCHG